MSSTLVTFHPLGGAQESGARYAVILTRMQGRWLFVRHGKWRGWKCPREECGDLQMEFELLTG